VRAAAARASYCEHRLAAPVSLGTIGRSQPLRTGRGDRRDCSGSRKDSLRAKPVLSALDAHSWRASGLEALCSHKANGGQTLRLPGALRLGRRLHFTEREFSRLAGGLRSKVRERDTDETNAFRRRETTGDVRLDDRKFGIPRRATASRLARIVSTSHSGVSTTFQSCQNLATGPVSAAIRPSSGECRVI
jgi:hypothetical protein